MNPHTELHGHHFRSAWDGGMQLSLCPSEPHGGSRSDEFSGPAQARTRFCCTGFGFRLLSALLASTTNTNNAALSGVNIAHALGMVANAATGETLTEVTAALGLQEHGDLSVFNRSVTEFRAAVADVVPEIKLRSSYGMWPAASLQLRQTFVQRLHEAFAAQIAARDYSQPEQVRAEINDWISRETNGKIGELIPYGLLAPDTVNTLVSALYLKAPWDSRFEVSATRSERFHISHDKTKYVEMMSQYETFGYMQYTSHEMRFQAARLPYIDPRAAMIVILPDQGVDVAAIVERFSLVPTFWDEVRHGLLHLADVDLKLPRFTIDTGFALPDLLAKLGIKRLFTDDAELTQMFLDTADMKVSDGIHHVKIEVTEEGTEAAAATGVAALLTSAREPVIFTVDRPFLSLIEYGGEILFQSVVRNP